MNNHMRVPALIIFLYCHCVTAFANDSTACISDHLSADDPTSSSRPIDKTTECIRLVFPNDVATWNVDVVVERDWPEIELKVSAGGDTGEGDKPKSNEESISLIKENIEYNRVQSSELALEMAACVERKDKDEITGCQVGFADQIFKLNSEMDYAFNLLNEIESMEIEEQSNSCDSVALESDCSYNINVSGLELGRGDKAVASVTFSVASNPDTKQEKTLNYYIPKKGEFRAGIGTMFIYSDSKDYFTRQSGDQFFVDSGGGSQLDLNLAVTATWVRFNQKGPQPFIGIGSDADDLSVFAGIAWTFHRGWSLNLGVAAHKESKLNSTFNEGMDFLIDSAVDSSVLVTDEYKLRPFLGLSWSPKSEN